MNWVKNGGKKSKEVVYVPVASAEVSCFSFVLYGPTKPRAMPGLPGILEWGHL